MLKLRILILTFLAIISCNCQKTEKKKTVQHKDTVESEYVSAFLDEKNYTILANVQDVIRFEIRKHLLEGTTNEYSNKLIIQDTLTKPKANELIKRLSNDRSYDWKVVADERNFEPTTQILLKSNGGRLNLLIDENFERMSFINLEGQKIVVLSKEFSLFLMNM